MTRRTIQPRPGRPTKAETAARHAHLLDMAGAVFSELGYASASIEQIAAQARVGKQTIYNRYGDKAGLFRAVASHMLHAPLLALDAGETDEALDAGLQRRLALVLGAAVEPHYAALFRLFLREATLFPDVFEAFYQVREKHVEQPLMQFLEGHVARGAVLKLPVDRCIELLMAMLNSFISIAALRGLAVTAERIEDEACGITQLFLHGAVRNE